MASAAVNEKAVNEEYKIWKKNTPFLYDLVMSHALEWPSLTVQWLPLKTIPTDSDYSEQKLVLGTHTSGTEQNFLMIAKAVLPLPETTIDARKFSEGATPGDVGGFGGPEAKIVIETRINHPGEVNRARYCPHNKFLIATKTVEGDVLVFDTIKHPPQPVETSVIDYQLSLRGHTKEGYGLEWSPNKLGYVASAADDGTICVWDTNATPEEAKQLDALHQLDAHSAVVEDVAWHAQHGEIFASVADNKQMMLWDLRELGAAKKPRQTVSNAHQSEINTVDFNPRNDFLLATGGADSVVKIWDMRKLDAGALHEFKGHDDEVVQAVWAPFGKGDVLASCACDRRVFVWDMSQVRSHFFLSCPLPPSLPRAPGAPSAHPPLTPLSSTLLLRSPQIGAEQTPQDAEDGPPELLFVHGGHTNKLSEIQWNPNSNEEWVMASVAEDNILQVWQMAAAISDPGAAEEGSEGAAAADGDLE